MELRNWNLAWPLESQVTVYRWQSTGPFWVDWPEPMAAAEVLRIGRRWSVETGLEQRFTFDDVDAIQERLVEASGRRGWGSGGDVGYHLGRG